jgi:hypothetical protein
MVLIDQAAEDGLSPDRTDIDQVCDRPHDHFLDRRRPLFTGLMRPLIIKKSHAITPCACADRN